MHAWSEALFRMAVAKNGPNPKLDLIILYQVGSGLTRKHKTGLERLTRDKHSSLIRESANNDSKKFYNLGPGLNSFYISGPCWLFGLSKLFQYFVLLGDFFVGAITLVCHDIWSDAFFVFSNVSWTTFTQFLMTFILRNNFFSNI